jgi:Mor family transcriptional regulator
MRTQLKNAVTEEVSKQIRADAKAGLSLPELCKKYNLSASAARRHAMIDFTPRLSETDQREIRRLHKEGLTYRELRERTGLSIYSIQAICTRRY